MYILQFSEVLCQKCEIVGNFKILSFKTLVLDSRLVADYVRFLNYVIINENYFSVLIFFVDVKQS